MVWLGVEPTYCSTLALMVTNSKAAAKRTEGRKGRKMEGAEEGKERREGGKKGGGREERRREERKEEERERERKKGMKISWI